MFTFHQHFDKLYQIQWYFPKEKKEDLEKRLYVVFKQVDDHYKLQAVIYTYMDIAYGLEDVDFVFEKTGDIMKMKILNI